MRPVLGEQQGDEDALHHGPGGVDGLLGIAGFQPGHAFPPTLQAVLGAEFHDERVPFLPAAGGGHEGVLQGHANVVEHDVPDA